MSTQRRILSSQANGRRSRGPVTTQGKARSSQNALTHGLLADCIVLPGESQQGFDALIDQHLERFGPADAIEEGIIEEMCAAYWRIRRAWAIENEWMTAELDALADGDPRGRAAKAFRKLATSPEIALLHRYESRLHHAYQRALRGILLLRAVDPAPIAVEETQNVDLPNEPSPISGHQDVRE